jgi:hypothetical protein
MTSPTQQKSDKKSTLVIPEEIQKQYAEYVELIKGSRSMDDEERQYWIDVLPIMSEDQMQNLRDILENERKQLQEAKKGYSNRLSGAVNKAKKAFDEAAYLEKKRARLEAEKRHEREEREREQAILEELKNM